MNPDQPLTTWVSSKWTSDEIDGKTVVFRLDDGLEVWQGIGILFARGRERDGKLFVKLTAENHTFGHATQESVELNQGLMDALKKLLPGSETDYSLNVRFQTKGKDSPPSADL